MIPGVLAVADKIASNVLDTLGIEPIVTKGEQLKKDLGLDEFNYVYIQKVLSIGLPIYIISCDSRYPHRYIPYAKLKNLRSSKFLKLKTNNGEEYKFSSLKLTPPFDIESTHVFINQSSLIWIRDLAGEYFRSGDFTQEINESKNKYKQSGW